MPNRLTIEETKRGSLAVKKITGFTDKELSELNSMDYREMKNVIMDVLLSRRMIPFGTYILSAWVTDKVVFIETGEGKK